MNIDFRNAGRAALGIAPSPGDKWVHRQMAAHPTKRAVDYSTPNSSTSNTSVAFGGITPPAPRAP